MTPYATAIVPTHDRRATLAAAVGSLQRQTVREIEILIVGDGPTPEVAAIARGLAAQDARVRFLEFDKAPGSGGANRDRAVREFARSDRIFYTDDDDLWLPQHVETLGPMLDAFDVVDSLPVSGTLCGRMALTAINSGAPARRALLAQGRANQMFDTHLAHRRSTYLEVGAGWTTTFGDVVLRLLGGFAAAPQVRWKTAPVATALSLHGGVRATWTPQERRTEIEAWSARTAGETPQGLTAQAHPAWPLFHLFNVVEPQAGDDVEAYLRRFGMTIRGAPDALAMPLDDARRADVETAFALHRGEAVGDDALRRVAPLLLDAVKTGVASWAFLRRALRRLPLAKARALVRSLPREDAVAGELLALFEGYQLLWARRPGEALALARAADPSTVRMRHELEMLLGDIHLALGEADAGFGFLRAAAARETRPSAISFRLANALLAAGRLAEAEACTAQIEARIGGLPAVVDLRRRLDAARAPA